MQIALLLPSSVFVGWLAGLWLDRHLHQEWISLAGMAFGGISGMVYVIRTILVAGRKLDRQSRIGVAGARKRRTATDRDAGQRSGQESAQKSDRKSEQDQTPGQ